MAIYIEGGDLAGKTTLGKKLAKRLGIPFLRPRNRGPNMSRLLLALARHRCAVVDRWWPSEWVYRTAEGQVPNLNLPELWSMNLLAERTGAVYVQLEPDEAKIMLRYAERPEDLPLAEILVIHGHYQLQNPSWWDYLPATRLVNPKIPTIIQTYEARLARAQAYPGFGIGSLTPDVLFVGEQLNPWARLSDALPFFSTQNKGACKSLYAILHGAGLRPSQVHLHNAYTQRGGPLLTAAMVAHLKPRRIIAMGNAAEAHLRVLDVPYQGHIPHPAWITRFDIGNLDRWITIVKELIA